jgi:hypothetical protein
VLSPPLTRHALREVVTDAGFLNATTKLPVL